MLPRQKWMRSCNTFSRDFKWLVLVFLNCDKGILMCHNTCTNCSDICSLQIKFTATKMQVWVPSLTIFVCVWVWALGRVWGLIQRRTWPRQYLYSLSAVPVDSDFSQNPIQRIVFICQNTWFGLCQRQHCLIQFKA